MDDSRSLVSCRDPARAVGGEISICFQPKKGGVEPMGPWAQAYYEPMGELVTISPDYLVDINAIPFGPRVGAVSLAALFAK